LDFSKGAIALGLGQIESGSNGSGSIDQAIAAPSAELLRVRLSSSIYQGSLGISGVAAGIVVFWRNGETAVTDEAEAIVADGFWGVAGDANNEAIARLTCRLNWEFRPGPESSSNTKTSSRSIGRICK